MTLRIHHLNCGTMAPAGGRVIDGRPGTLRTARLVCHCLLIDTDDGLVLIDSGLGMDDVLEPNRRLGRVFTAAARPQLRAEETAIAQVRALGFRPDDVRHIILTHLDLDHAGGLSDFPNASVHVLAAEHAAAMRPASVNERNRYRAAQWQHAVKWVPHGLEGERWFGFESVEAVGEILLVPLTGHTRGHAGVAVPAGDGWIIHCGDAYFFRREVETPPRSTRGLTAFQRMVAVDEQGRSRNQERLRHLRRTQSPAVRLICAHDPVEFDRSG